LKIEILCWRIMTPSLRGGSISLGYLATGPARGLGNLHFQSHPLVGNDMGSFPLEGSDSGSFIFTWNWEDY
ncbi:hypothetical protein ACLCDG_07745, partial [Coxiella burnetii]